MSGGSEHSTEYDEIDPSHVSSFCKYCSDCEPVIKGIFENHKIRFTPPCELNDPLEANPTIRFEDRSNYRWFRHNGITLPSKEVWIRLHHIQRKINRFGILSLTKIWDSFDMWSRYANGHKGFLLILKGDFNEQPCMLSAEGKPYDVRKVDYPPEHAIEMKELVDGQGCLRWKEFYERLFFQKVSRWQAEHEYRMVRPLSDQLDCMPSGKQTDANGLSGLFDFSPDCVEAVVFGACMSVEKRRWIMKTCQASGIDFSQAYIVRDKGERDAMGGKMGKVVVPPPVLSLGLIDVFPCILDSAYIEEQKTKLEVASLSELPYWRDDPEWVQEWYHNLEKREHNES